MPNDDEDERRRAARERAAAERKETEDLLAGFDRPGRTPRPPGALRDFVEFHGERHARGPERDGPAAARGHVPVRADVAPERPAKPVQKDIATFVLPERATRRRWLLAALLLVVAMPLFGGGVAYCLLAEPDAVAPAARPGPSPGNALPSSVTTASTATVPSVGPRGESSPPSPAPPAPVESASGAALAPPSSARPRSTPPPSAPAHPASSDPRVDFIRNL